MKVSHILLIVGAIIIFLLIVAQQSVVRQPYIEVGESRQSDNLDRLLFSLSPEFSVTSDILIVGDTLYIASGTASNGLTAIDMNTQEELVSLDFAAINLAYDEGENLIYAVLYRQGIGLQRSILALDIDNSVVWRNDFNNMNHRGSTVLYVNSSGNDFARLPNDELVQIDSDTGAFLTLTPNTSISSDVRSSIIHYWRVYGGILQAYSFESSTNPVWESDIISSPCYLNATSFTDEIVVIACSGVLLVVDYPSGNLIWQYDTTSIISNIVIVNEQILVMDDVADLLRFNLNSGELLSTMPFTNPIEDNYNSINNTLITANDRYVVILFGDTRDIGVYDYRLP